jgi:hypothetical protein
VGLWKAHDVPKKGRVPPIPRNLRDRLRVDRVVLFVGSGLSLPAGAPAWDKLLQLLLEEVHEEGIDLDAETLEELGGLLEGPPADKILAAGYLRRQLGDACFGRFIGKTFDGLSRQAVHDEIAKLRLHGVVTTNYDRLLEEVLPRWPVVLPSTETWDPTQPRFLLKLHGSCQPDPHTVVVAPDDYRDILKNERLMENMRLLYRSYTFLFVGFGLADPDTVATLEPLKALFGRGSVQHYALLEAGTIGPIREAGLARQLNVKALKYHAADETHDEVVTFLSNLADTGAIETGAKIKTRWALLVGFRKQRSTHLLVKDATKGWRIDGELPYMLPNLAYDDDVEKLHRDAAFQFEMSEDQIKVTPHGEVFATSNKKPGGDPDVVYHFRLAVVELSEQPRDGEAHFVEVSDRPARFLSLTDIRNNDATSKVNGDVFARLSDEFGSGLERLPPAVT